MHKIRYWFKVNKISRKKICICIDVGASDRAGDAGIYTDSDLKRALGVNSINLPPPESVNGIPGHKVHYHIVGDDAFSLSMNMMNPIHTEIWINQRESLTTASQGLDGCLKMHLEFLQIDFVYI